MQNNLKQLGLAANGFYGVNNRYPPGVNLPISSTGIRPTNVIYTSGQVTAGPDPTLWYGWPIALLTYIEQDNVYNQLNLTGNQYGNAAGPNSPAAAVIKTFLCPSDLNVLIPTVTSGTSTFGMTSYGGNAGQVSWYYTSDGPGYPGATFDGVLYYNSQITIPALNNGTSGTILFGERYHFDSQWASLPTYGWWASANFDSPEDILLSAANVINWTIPAGLGPKPAYSYTDMRLAVFGSNHTGGANFGLCDGSVRFLSNNTPLSLLQQLCNRNNQVPVTLP